MCKERERASLLSGNLICFTGKFIVFICCRWDCMPNAQTFVYYWLKPRTDCLLSNWIFGLLSINIVASGSMQSHEKREQKCEKCFLMCEHFLLPAKGSQRRISKRFIFINILRGPEMRFFSSEGNWKETFLVFREEFYRGNKKLCEKAKILRAGKSFFIK